MTPLQPPGTAEPSRINITVITCRGCGREVERERHDNSLVGQQARLRCSACGHRGADLIVTWKWAQRPEREGN